MKEKVKVQKNIFIKNTSGIILIALVVTIIATLILANVSISLILNNGLFSHAEMAADVYSQEQVGEKSSLMMTEYEIELHDNPNLTIKNFLDVRLEKGKITNYIDVGDGNYAVILGSY